MSKATKVTKVASAPSVAAKAAKETTGSIVSIGVMVLLLIFVVIPMLPSLGEQAVKATAKATLDGASRLPSYPLPANGNRTAPSVPTTTPAPKPYEGSNGAIRPLPSQTPPIPSGALGPGEGLGPLGELLAKLPEVGPAIEGGLKAIAPAAETLKKAP